MATDQSIRRVILPEPPDRYGREDQTQTRRTIEQFSREVQAKLVAIEDRLTALESA